jgi:hypothetical protein
MEYRHSPGFDLPTQACPDHHIRIGIMQGCDKPRALLEVIAEVGVSIDNIGRSRCCEACLEGDPIATLGTETTRAPMVRASPADPSVEPLSATMTSTASGQWANAMRACVTASAIVAHSFRHGITTVTPGPRLGGVALVW